MEQQGLDEPEGKKEADEKKEYLTPPEKAKLLLELDFQETAGKPGLWYKKIDDDTVFFWSFQKTKKGVSWCNRNKVKIPESEKKAMSEYTYLRQEVVEDQKTDTKQRKSKGKPSTDHSHPEKPQRTSILETRGDAHTLMNLKDDNQVLDEIRGRYLSDFVYSFKTKEGMVTGLSWAGTKEIARLKGNISVVDVNINETKDEFRILAQAKNLESNVTMFGIGVQPKQLTLKSGTKIDDVHALSKGVSKAQRNAIRALIPEMYIKEMMNKFMENN